MPFDNLLVQRESRIAVLTVQRPTRLNALDASTLDELRQAVLDLQHDDSIRCVIVTGAGEKALRAIEIASLKPRRRPRPASSSTEAAARSRQSSPGKAGGSRRHGTLRAAWTR